ncbi:MAG: hypothetical protein HUJ75_03990, partial [Parasporobacterium sp.]|nr:hypothetical protein [Parasporobacterium sp.]
MQQKTKNLLKAVIFTVIMAAVLIGLNRILMPRTDFSAPIDRGVDEPDYILLGTSNVFYSLNPTVVWDEAGFTGYNVSSEEAPTMLSYYYLKDALKHRVPEVVYFEPTGFRFNYGNAAMNQLGVDKYPWGIDKFNLIMELQADDKVIGEN